LSVDKEPIALMLTGPIGVGKSTLGRRLADSLAGQFVESDDFRRTGLHWTSSILTTSRHLLSAIVKGAATFDVVVIANPMRHREYCYFAASLERRGIRFAVIGLDAGPDAICRPSRGRVFSGAERARIREMISDGYGQRPFCSAVLRTDVAGLEQTSRALLHIARDLMRNS
jgi:AAA domain